MIGFPFPPARPAIPKVYVARSVFPTLHHVRRTRLVFDFLDGNRSGLMSAGECSVERYEQDRNVFILLIANEREF
jgi:hypothetical protein